MTRTFAGQALAYARHGWPVFPCQPDSKEPATRHGFLDATTDPDRIRRWWDRQPAANVAIATAPMLIHHGPLNAALGIGMNKNR